MSSFSDSASEYKLKLKVTRRSPSHNDTAGEISKPWLNRSMDAPTDSTARASEGKFNQSEGGFLNGSMSLSIPTLISRRSESIGMIFRCQNKV